MEIIMSHPWPRPMNNLEALKSIKFDCEPSARRRHRRAALHKKTRARAGLLNRSEVCVTRSKLGINVQCFAATAATRHTKATEILLWDRKSARG
jgi:hypothetical protein